MQPGWAVAPPRSAGEARSRLRQFQNEFLDAKLDDASQAGAELSAQGSHTGPGTPSTEQSRGLESEIK